MHPGIAQEPRAASFVGPKLLRVTWRLVTRTRAEGLLGFSILLKFFDLEGRFPEDAGKVPQPAIEYVAGLVKVASQAWADYTWDGRTIKLHRAEIRKYHGFRESTSADEEGSRHGWLRMSAPSSSPKPASGRPWWRVVAPTT